MKEMRNIYTLVENLREKYRLGDLGLGTRILFMCRFIYDDRIMVSSKFEKM